MLPINKHRKDASKRKIGCSNKCKGELRQSLATCKLS